MNARIQERGKTHDRNQRVENFFASANQCAADQLSDYRAAKEALIYSVLPRAMDGAPANQPRKWLIQRSRVRTCAGLGVG
jgi:hypothetical protein